MTLRELRLWHWRCARRQMFLAQSYKDDVRGGRHSAKRARVCVGQHAFHTEAVAALDTVLTDTTADQDDAAEVASKEKYRERP